MVHLSGIAAGQVAASAAVDKDRVPGNQDVFIPEALTTGRVSRSQKAFDLDPADLDPLPVFDLSDIFVVGF